MKSIGIPRGPSPRSIQKALLDIDGFLTDPAVRNRTSFRRKKEPFPVIPVSPVGRVSIVGIGINEIHLGWSSVHQLSRSN